MCGIAGIIAHQEDRVRGTLPAMVRAQRHRGPDDSGESYLPLGEALVGLGHRRLSILDLSGAGHQPMVHPGTGDQIIFNGEIYNFAPLRDELERSGERFIGTSDTEVLLHGLSRWGADFLARLQGMFALAFYSAREQSLLLARDPVGIKPLYVAQAAGAILFASEVRAILASGLVPPRLDRRGVASLLAYGAVQEPMTVFQNVCMFPAGRYQIFTASGPAAPPQAYWSYPAPDPRICEGQAVEAIAGIMDAAVRDHLVADVPVGVFLSSGLDSTIIAGLAARHTPHLRSFTVGFGDQPDMSELELSRQTAQRFGLDHTEIVINNSDAEGACEEWLAALDQPSMDGLNVYIISKAVRAQGIKVALSGQGGDELFGGYSTFRDVPRLAELMRKMRWLPAPLRTSAASVAWLKRSRAQREKLLDMAGCDGSVRSLYFHRRRAMSEAQLEKLGISWEVAGLTPEYQTPEMMEQLPMKYVLGRSCEIPDIVWRISRLETQFYQGNILLRDGDANGMAHSLEIRVPMLDQRMLNLALSIPGPVRLPPGKPGKHLLRQAFSDLLGPEVLAQKKRGFGLPIGRWMAGPLRQRCQEALEKLKSLSLLQPCGVDAIWKSFLAEPESPQWSRAFTLVALGTYAQRMGATA